VTFSCAASGDDSVIGPFRWAVAPVPRAASLINQGQWNWDSNPITYRHGQPWPELVHIGRDCGVTELEAFWCPEPH